MDSQTLRKFYKTVVISDVHLGHKLSQVVKAGEFLSSVNCKRLILNGDIFDGWQLMRSGKRWKPEYTNFLKILMRIIDNPETEIIYIIGNHDAFLENIIPFYFANMSVVRDYILESGDKKFFVTHGDVFDYVNYNMQWLAKLGEFGYRILMLINKLYNKYRFWRGKEEIPLAIRIKRRIERAVTSSEIDQLIVDIANAYKCDGVICGHTHQAADRMISGIRYLNCGAWLENMTALLEDEGGKWSILQYEG